VHGCIVVVLMQSVRIGKMRSGAAKLGRPGVHHIHKGRNTPRNVLGHDIAGLVCRDDHHAVENIFQRHFLAGNKAGRAAGRVQTGQGGFAYCNNVGEIAVFKRKQTGHDFRKTCGIDFFIRVLFVERAAGIEIDEQCRFCIDRETFHAFRASGSRSGRSGSRSGRGGR